MKVLRRAVLLAGSLPPAKDLDPGAILKALAGDKKSVGGSIQWVLLERIGKACIVDGRTIPEQVLRSALKAAL